ncbi:hypothetical protein pb186bvf_014373 [Paramecium bursaria]
MSAKVVENYSLLEVIGQGQYGKVYKALNIKNNQLVAVKVVKIEKFKEVPKLEEFTMNEIQTLARINNPYVLKFIEMLKSSRNYYFVYEFCNGQTLEQVIQEQGVLPEKEALNYFKQILAAFQSLQKENIIHRDLKPSNIMLHNGQVKLGDFGFCKALNTPEDLSQTMVGSPIYMAPEILKGLDYTMKADIWSLGCVLYELLYGVCPYEEKTMAQLMSAVEEKEVQFLDNTNYVSQQTKDLLLRMLTKDPVKRINWKDLFERELTYAERLNVQANPIQQELNLNQQRNKESKAFKYLLLERNKIFYLYKLVEEVIELSRDEREEARESQAIYCGYLLVKYVCYMIETIRINLVEKFNVAAFPHLAKKTELQNDLTRSFEYKSFCTLIQKEVETARKMFKHYQEESDKYFKQQQPGQRIYQGNEFLHFEQELQREIVSAEISITFMKKFVLKYCEDIKSQFLQQFLDKSSVSGSKQLLHIEKILESLIIDEFFENCMDVQQIDLEQQNYFNILNKYSKSDLLQVVTNKMDYIRHKLYK